VVAAVWRALLESVRAAWKPVFERSVDDDHGDAFNQYGHDLSRVPGDAER
jgi:hypothetical protein